MCLITFAFQVHPEYPLVVAANRDEFHSRATQPAHWWPEFPDLLAGKDLQANGTWMGITRNGLFAAVTNVREPHSNTNKANSRGELPRDYLQLQPSTDHFIARLLETQSSYQGYNLVFGSIDNLWFFSNCSPEPIKLKPGIYGLSNASLDTPWPKVQKSKAALKSVLNHPHITTEQLLQVMSSTSEADDDELPSTGVGLEWERRLSAIRIVSDNYGTRSSTALLVNPQGVASFQERTLVPNSNNDVSISFHIKKKAARNGPPGK